MKDPQKDPLYSWEEAWWGWSRSLITLGEAKEWIEWACTEYKIGVPKITKHKRGLSWFDPNINTISMNSKTETNIPIALHEAAHVVIWEYFGDTVEDHGTAFVGVYLELLAAAGIAPRSALEASLKEYKIKWKIPLILK